MLSSGPPKILQFIPSRRPAVMARMRNGLSAPHALGVLHPFVLRPWRSAWSQAERSGFRECWSLWRQKASCPLPDEASAGVASLGASPVIPKRLAGIPIHVLLLQAGRLAGLEAWAWRDEARELQALRELCRSHGFAFDRARPYGRLDHTWPAGPRRTPEPQGGAVVPTLGSALLLAASCGGC